MAAAHEVTKDRPAVTWALLVVRLVVGIIFMAHGSQKVFGAFGGPGPAMIVKLMGPIGYLVMTAEFFGGLGLIVGVLTRFSAFWLIVVMANAVATVHGKNGFFLNPRIGPKGPLVGFEFNLALVGLLAAILLAGPGSYALGRLVKLTRHPVLE